MEHFAELPGYEGRFLVSDHGTVRVTPYIAANGQRRAPRTLVQRETHNGYKQVRLSYEGVKRQRMVSHLVLETFVGPAPDGMEACHNDGDKQNNHVSNLRWDTHQNNVLEKRDHGTDHQVNKTHCPSGHPLSGENCYTPPGTRYRMCRTCMRRHARNYQARKRKHG